MPQFHIYKTAEEVTNALAAWLKDYITDILKKQDRFTIALSGGSTPKKLYELLATAYKDKIAWQPIHVFWGDERVVSFDDKENNARMAYDSLLDHVPIPSSQIHKIQTDIKPAESAKKYEQLLHDYFDDKSNTFDIVLLGMGDDGHTLSLFPGEEVLHEKVAWVKAYHVKKLDANRITLTADVVNKSAAIAFFVTGESKANALHEVIEGVYKPDKYPAQLIKPVNGNMHLFADEAAGKDLHT